MHPHTHACTRVVPACTLHTHTQASTANSRRNPPQVVENKRLRRTEPSRGVRSGRPAIGWHNTPQQGRHEDPRTVQQHGAFMALFASATKADNAVFPEVVGKLGYDATTGMVTMSFAA